MKIKSLRAVNSCVEKRDRIKEIMASNLVRITHLGRVDYHIDMPTAEIKDALQKQLEICDSQLGFLGVEIDDD